ncbi:unnamed protein product, partial [Didymodactylos carnosus]
FNKKKFQNSRIERWQLELSEYHFDKIRYKRGRYNCNADLLSRFPFDKADTDNDAHPLRIRLYTPSTIDSINTLQVNAISRSTTRQLLQNRSSPASSSSTSLSTTTITRSKTKKNTIRGSRVAADVLVSHSMMTTTSTADNPSQTIDFSIDRIRNKQIETPRSPLPDSNDQ